MCARCSNDRRRSHHRHRCPAGIDATAVASTCEQATHVIGATQGSWPQKLSPAGHVVTSLYQSETRTSLETLHGPDGTTADLVDGDRQLTGTRDINRRGVVVGTEQYSPEITTVLYQPWVYRNGRVHDLATPGRQGEGVRKDYWALAINSRSAVVGFKTNRDRYDATDPEYVARPVLWPKPRSTPIKLAMPDGYYGDASGPFLDIQGDGTITGIVRDRAERNNYLAMWLTPVPIRFSSDCPICGYRRRCRASGSRVASLRRATCSFVPGPRRSSSTRRNRYGHPAWPATGRSSSAGTTRPRRQRPT